MHNLEAGCLLSPDLLPGTDVLRRLLQHVWLQLVRRSLQVNNFSHACFLCFQSEGKDGVSPMWTGESLAFCHCRCMMLSHCVTPPSTDNPFTTALTFSNQSLNEHHPIMHTAEPDRKASLQRKNLNAYHILDLSVNT